MKTRKFVLTLAAAGLALGSTSVAADADQPWHLTGQIGGTKVDSARYTDDDIWWSVGFGRFFGNNISLDIEYDEFDGTFSPPQGTPAGASWDTWKLSTTSLVGRYHFGDRQLRPYLLLGGGQTKHRNVLDDGTAAALSLGAGVQGKISKHLSGRAQVMYRFDADNETFDSHGSSKYRDWFFSVGISFDFGGHPPPPPPPPEEPKAPPPPPPVNPDLDGDGVLNERDKCPNTRPGAVVDLDGCEVEAVIELEGVHFDFDKATLRPEAKAILNEAAALLNKHERVVVEVAGHTDSVGAEAYNQGLSERRANAVEDYLTDKGVKASRLSARGHGESRPVASNDTKEGRAENRRVELIVLDR